MIYHHPPQFKLLDNGTLFMAEQVWHNELDVLEICLGAWEFAHVAGVLAPVASQFPTLEGPTCVLLWKDEHLHIRAEFEQVLQAWRRYRQRYGEQRIRLVAN